MLACAAPPSAAFTPYRATWHGVRNSIDKRLAVAPPESTVCSGPIPLLKGGLEDDLMAIVWFPSVALMPPGLKNASSVTTARSPPFACAFAGWLAACSLAGRRAAAAMRCSVGSCDDEGGSDCTQAACCGFAVSCFRGCVCA